MRKYSERFLVCLLNYVDRGDTVTLNVVPDEGYEIGDLIVRSQRKALPGDVVTLSSEAYDP